MKARFPLVLIASLLAAGCVSKKRYEALEGEIDATRAALKARDAENGAMASTLEELEGEVVRLEAVIGDLEASIEALEADLDAEREKSSRILADKGALRSEIASMKEALVDLESRRKQAEARVEAYRDLVARFQSLIDAGKLDVRIVDGRMVVVMKTDILFPSGSADLSPEGNEAVAQVAAVLAEIPGRRYQVEGHTDDVPIHNARFASNWYLAAARAIGVVNSMIESGLPADVVSAAAFAAQRAVGDNATPEGRALNRRIEIVVVPDLADLPGYDELSALEPAKG